MTEQALQDAILKHTLQILRLSAGEQGEVDKILVELARELRDLVNTANLSDATKRDVDALIRSAEDAIKVGYKRADACTDTYTLAVIVAEKAQEIVQDTIPAEVRIPTDTALMQLGKDVLIDGSPASAWWAKQSDDLSFRFAAQVRQGMANSETQEQIVARIVGKRGEPGIMDVARRNARALVHSSVMTAANQARLATFRKNSRVIAGVRWLSTLDGHTCWTAETLVLMADGSHRPIAEIRENDMVIGGISGLPCRVDYAGKRLAPSTVAIYKNGHAIGRSTDDHPILTPQGWREIGSVALSADLHEREVLCRTSQASERPFSPTPESSGDGLPIRPVQCVAEVRRTDDADCRQSGGLRDSLCDGDRPDCADRDIGSEGLQHDAGRRWVQPFPGDCSGDGAEAFSEVLGGRGISRTDAGCAEARCSEGCDHPQGLVSDAGGSSIHRCAHQQPRVVGEDSREEPGARETAGSSRRCKCGNREEMGRPSLSREGECSAGSQAGGITGGPGMEGPARGEVRGGDAPEMAGPGVSREDGSAQTARSHAGSKGSGSLVPFGEHQRGAAFGCGAEVVGNPESTYVETISGELIDEPAEVYTLTIEGDPTFVAGGLIVHNCARCAALDGQAWNLDGEKLPGTKVAFMAPPIHFGDRCILSPIPKTFRDIGLDVDEPDAGQRASSLGPVHGKTTFDDFLKRQSAEFINATLGKQRAAMFNEGKLTVKDLVSGTGRELTLAELRNH